MVLAANFRYSVLPTTFFEENEERCRCIALVMGVTPSTMAERQCQGDYLLKTFREVGDVVRFIKIHICVSLCIYINLLRGAKENRLMELRVKATQEESNRIEEAMQLIEDILKDRRERV